MKEINTVGCNHPQVAFSVLIELTHKVAGQALSTSDVLHILAMHSKHSLLQRPDPERPFAIHKKGSDREGGTVQFWHLEGLPNSIDYFLKAQSRARHRHANQN